MNQAKQALREKLSAERSALTPEAVHGLSARICETLKKSADWSSFRNIHCYEPILSLNEVDVTPFAQFIIDSFKDIELYTTRIFNDVWQHTRWHDRETTEDLPQFDAIIVPTLSFDAKLYRLGLGLGFYDRFLVTQPGAQKIGVCFEQGRHETLPIEPHDVPLDAIITEANTY